MDKFPADAVIDAYEAEIHQDEGDEFSSEFIRYVEEFDAAQDELLIAIMRTEKGMGSLARIDAANTADRLAARLGEALEDLAVYVFDEFPADEAMSIWSGLVWDNQAKLHGVMRHVNPLAEFDLLSEQEIARRAQSFALGKTRLRSDIAREDEAALKQSPVNQSLSPEYPHEITADDEIDWYDLSLTPEEDEYGQWVHHKYTKELKEQVRAFLRESHE